MLKKSHESSKNEHFYRVKTSAQTETRNGQFSEPIKIPNNIVLFKQQLLHLLSCSQVNLLCYLQINHSDKNEQETKQSVQATA